MQGTTTNTTPLSARRAAPSTRKSAGTSRLPSGWDGVEVVPDSEEERERERERERCTIDISSDSDEERVVPKRRPGDLRVPSGTPSSSKKTTAPSGTPGTPTLLKRNVVTGAPRFTPGTPSSSKKKAPSVQESFDISDDEVVEIPRPAGEVLVTPKAKDKARTPSPRKSVRSAPPAMETVEDSDVEIISGPVPTSTAPRKSPAKHKAPSQAEDAESDAETASYTTSTTSSTDSSLSRATGNTRDKTIKYSKYWLDPGRLVVPSPKKKTLSQAERMLHNFLTELGEYSTQVYSWMNRKVFNNRLPTLDEVQIIWSNTLLTTAGRSHYRRDPQGQVTVSIHLAVKILDTHEKIRNTVSHEMCHLASWMIDGDVNARHGPLFHKWADLIMKKDRDVRVSVYHSYEIVHPWTWECVDCGHIMGRWSNSLKPDKTKCEECKVGQMEALGTPDPDDHRVVSRSSKHAAQPRGSPRPRLPAASSAPQRLESVVSASPAPRMGPRLPHSLSLCSHGEVDADSDSDSSSDGATAGKSKKLPSPRVHVVHGSDSEDEPIGRLTKQFKDGFTITSSRLTREEEAEAGKSPS